jgi:hypothetical protein
VADRLVQQDAGPAGPSTTVIVPAGAGFGAEVDARLMHRVARVVVQHVVAEVAVVVAPAAAGEPCSRRPSSSMITVIDTRTSGRTSAARWPSLRATSTTSHEPAMCAMTWVTRGSSAAGEGLEALEQLDLGGRRRANRAGRRRGTGGRSLCGTMPTRLALARPRRSRAWRGGIDRAPSS